MRKLQYALNLSLASLLLAGAAAPAMASATQVPEPGTLSLLTVGIGGAYLVSWVLRRK